MAFPKGRPCRPQNIVYPPKARCRMQRVFFHKRKEPLMAKLWAGRTDAALNQAADDFNASIRFDSRM